MAKELIELPKNIFITGKSSAGKTTLAENCLSRISDIFNRTFLIVDGTELYDFSVLYPFQGHSLKDRSNRSLHLMRLLQWLNSKGIYCLVPIIGQPLEIRSDWGTLDSFIEIHLDCDFDICLDRDDKGVYNRQSNVIGKTIEYCTPENPYLNLNSGLNTSMELCEKILSQLKEDFCE
jgi:adenylylsulfate kinase